MSETRTTVYLDVEMYRRIKTLAVAEGRPAAALIREAVAEYTGRRAPVAQPRSIGAGHSGRGNLSERAESLLKGLGARR